jgi:hypothetical protein
MWNKFIMAQPKHHHVWILSSLQSKYAHDLSHGLCGTARMDTLPEWSKGVDSRSTSASCVGSNPTGVIHDLGVDGRMEAHVNTTFLYSFLSFLLPFSVQCYYLCISFALPRSLSLFLSCSLSLSLTISLSFSCSCGPLLSPRPRVSFTRMLGSRRAARVHVERAAHPSTLAVQTAIQS